MAGHVLTCPLRQIWPGWHSSHVALPVRRYPGTHWQSAYDELPSGDEKLAGHWIDVLALPPGQ